MRWIVRIVGALLVAGLLLVGGLLLLPGEKIAQVAVGQIQAATGRDVSVEGGVELSFYPVLGVRTGPVTIANADWSDEPVMLRAEGLSVGVGTTALWRGQVKIRAIELLSPDILLERSRDGSGNWEIDGESAGSGGRQLAVSLDRVEVTDGRLRYVDHSDGSRHGFESVDATLLAPDLDGRADIDLGLRMEGGAERLYLAGWVAQFMPFLQGEVVPVEAELRAGDGTIDFEGRANASGDAEGRIKLDLPRTGAILAALGEGAGDPPEGLGRAIRGETLMVLKNGRTLSLREMALRLDDNAINGDLDVTLDGKPQVMARLYAGALDLAALTGGDGGGGPDDGWSRDSLDASGLGAFDGQVRLTADSVDLGTVAFGQSDVTLTVERSRAVFSLNALKGYGGDFGGEFVMNNRSGLSVGGDLSMGGVEMRELLNDLAGVTRLSGEADGQVRFLGVGQSTDAIMKSLSGEGRVAMGRGVIEGVDLDRLMRSGDGSGGTTIFDELAATFTMAEGDMRNDDLGLMLPGVEATGKGRIGLGARDIDYLFTPVALNARGGRGLAIPVRIRGPWSDPRITPDLAAAVDFNLDEEKKELERKAEERVQEELRKQLDVETQDGEKVEDALKRKAEDEIRRGLMRLLE